MTRRRILSRGNARIAYASLCRYHKAFPSAMHRRTHGTSSFLRRKPRRIRSIPSDFSSRLSRIRGAYVFLFALLSQSYAPSPSRIEPSPAGGTVFGIFVGFRPAIWAKTLFFRPWGAINALKSVHIVHGVYHPFAAFSASVEMCLAFAFPCEHQFLFR